MRLGSLIRDIKRSFARAFILAACAGAVALAVPASNQALSFADLIANQAGNYTWKTSAPASSARIVAWSDFTTYVNTKSCYVSNSVYILGWADILACSAAHTTASHVLNFSGTAAGAATCNASCASSGGSAEQAVPFTQSFTASVVDGTHPVTYAFTITPDAGAVCSWTITDSASATQASGSATATSTNITVGAVGTWTLTLNETITPANGVPKSCALSSGSITSYY